MQVRPGKRYNIDRLASLEKELALQGVLFKFGTITSVSYDVVARCYPKANPQGQMFGKLVNSLNRHIYKEITKMIWEVILRGDEFVFPGFAMSFLLVQRNTSRYSYAKLFPREEAVFVEVRQFKPRKKARKKHYIYGFLLKKGMEEVIDRINSGYRYQTRSQIHVDYKNI